MRIEDDTFDDFREAGKDLEAVVDNWYLFSPEARKRILEHVNEELIHFKREVEYDE